MPRGRLLITHSEGSIWHCARHEDKKPEMIVHHNIRPVNLRAYQDDVKFTKTLQANLLKRYPKQAAELFLCRYCWEVEWYNDPSKYEEGVGQFTSLPRAEWQKRDWMTVDEAVEKIKNAGWI
jgi:hypothetical protein